MVVLCVIGAGVKAPNGQRVAVARRIRAVHLQAAQLGSPAPAMVVQVSETVVPTASPKIRPVRVDAYQQTSVPTGTTPAQLLADANLVLTPAARQDLAGGLIAQPVLDFLAWATQGHVVAISVLKTEHPEYVEGTERVSLHFEGRAVDVYGVDHNPIAPDNATGRRFAEAVAALRSGRPTEVGSPWADLDTLPGFFSDANHSTHLHLGWAPA